MESESDKLLRVIRYILIGAVVIFFGIPFVLCSLMIIADLFEKLM